MEATRRGREGAVFAASLHCTKTASQDQPRVARATVFRIAAVIDCLILKKSCQGSRRNAASRWGTERISNSRTSALPSSSLHASGVETVAPGRARVEYGATDVAPRALRK